MNIMDRLSGSEIRDIAFRTIGQRENSYWKELRMGKLTASNFGLAVRILRNKRPKDITELRARIHHPRSLDNIPAVRWGITNEARAIEEFKEVTGAHVRPTGLWMFRNNYMGASPDGIIYADDVSQKPLGIIEVKCPYSLRDITSDDTYEWVNQLPYMDSNRQLKKDHDYYHQIQGTMYAVGVPWCDFIIWTPGSLYFHRIKKDPEWAKYIPALEDLYSDRLQRDELGDSTDSEEEKKRERGWGRHGQKSRWFGDLMRMEDVNAILHHPTAAFEEHRFYVMQCFQIHLGRWIYL